MEISEDYVTKFFKQLRDKIPDFVKVLRHLKMHYTGNPYLQNKVLETFKDDNSSIAYFIKGFTLFSLSGINREDRHYWNETKYFKQGVEYYEKAIEQGLTQLYYYLGNLFIDIPEAKTIEKGLNYFNKGTEQNVATCYYKLAIYHKDGRLLPKDFTKAMKYFTKAMEKGHISSFLTVGHLYETGSEHTELDLVKARYYYEQAFIRTRCDSVLDYYCRVLVKLNTTVYDEYATLIKEHEALKVEHKALKAEHAELSLLPDAPGYFSAKHSFENSVKLKK